MGVISPSKGRKIMQTVGAKEAKDRFGDLLQSVQREPVSILRNGRPAAVLVSPDDYAHMEGRGERVRGLLEDIRREASANGLTPAILHDLLANE